MIHLTPTLLIEDDLRTIHHELDTLLASGADETWVDILRQRHSRRHILRSMEEAFACHDAACRPPTSGGTGGSSPKGGKTQSATGKHSRTKFTEEISAMIRGNEHLSTLSAAHFEKLTEDRYQEKITRARDKERRGIIDNDIAYDYAKGRDPDKRAVMDSVMEELRTVRNRIDKMTDPDFTPATDMERTVHEGVQRFLGRSEFAKGVEIEVSDGVSLRLRGFNHIRGSAVIEVTAEMEQAVNKVGQRINAEIESRMGDFDELAVRVAHGDAKAAVSRMIGDEFPGYTGDVAFFRQIDGGLSANLMNIEVGDRHPEVIARLKELSNRIDAYAATGAITHNDPDAAVEYARGMHFQRTAKEVLGEVRSMDGTFSGTPRKVALKKDAWRQGFSTHDQVIKGAEFYPTDWINRSNEHPFPLGFKQTKSRAHYMHRNKDGGSTITLSGELRTTVHEMAHRMEAVVPGVLGLEAAFYNRRTAGESLKRMGQGYGAKEVTREDQFYDRYVGKSYNETAYEVLSMGTQQLTSHATWSKVDPDYQAFVLGTMATAYWKE